MSLAQKGFAVVNFTYRLAPEFKYPAPLEDTNLVFSWVLEHEAEYNLDTRHIFAVGDSAGGNILGLYCAICTNPEYAGHYSFQVPQGFVPQAVALNCGDYVVEAAHPSPDNHTLELMADYLPGKGTKEEMALMNVTAHVTEKFPPVFLMTASGDFLKEQALLMASALTRHNVPFLYRFTETVRISCPMYSTAICALKMENSVTRMNVTIPEVLQISKITKVNFGSLYKDKDPRRGLPFV